MFAERQIRKGETIERAPVIIIPAQQREYIDKTVLYNYYFGWGENFDEAAIALGFGSLYNHAYLPNARYVKLFDELVVEFVAVRDIAEGEEITVNYNGSPEDRTPVWFDVVS